jgi:hypothetical protein
MSRFVIPVKDTMGNTVYFETSPHKGQITVDGYEQVVMWLEKNNFKLATNVPVPVAPAPQATTPPQSGQVCQQCGSPMKFMEGIGKTGKPYKGYFCTGPDKGHPVVWLK